MALEIRELDLPYPSDKQVYFMFIGKDKYVLDTTVTASYEVVDQWVTKALEGHKFEENSNKLVVGIGMQWINVRGIPFKHTPPAILQLCIKSHCLIYQLCHSFTPSAMLRKLFGYSDKFVHFICLRCPDDFVQKLDLIHSVHELKFSGGNMPVDLRPQVASTEENGLCPTLSKIAQKYLGFSELDMGTTKSNWVAHQLKLSQVIYASIVAFLPYIIELKWRIRSMQRSSN